jgi:hypothetical protein
MSNTSRIKWKQWQKLWFKRQKRLKFYQALSAFQERNLLNIPLKISQKKQRLYKRRMNIMYRKKLKSLSTKFLLLKKKILKFQLKYGIYDE